MVLVLLYWIYLAGLCSTFGICIQSFYKAHLHPSVIFLLGAFAITLLASLYSFFGGLSSYFEGSLFILSIVLLFTFKNRLKDFFTSLKTRVSRLSLFSKILLATCLILCALQSASAPYIIDNESYYLQTIEWLDHYGLVKGVANLHPFLMQFSGWHILQSATNLEIAGLPLNDLSSFMLAIGILYSIEKMDNYLHSSTKHSLYAGFFLVFMVFLFRFISVPSPDVAVYIIALIVFYESFIWLKKSEKTYTTLHVLFLIAVFGIYIKLTALLVLLFPLIAYILSNSSVLTNNFDSVRFKEITLSRKLKSPLTLTAFISVLSGALFLCKNHIISGYAFFPLHVSIYDPQWKVPENILSWYTGQTYLDAFQTTRPDFLKDLSFLEVFIQWLSLAGLDGYLNKAMVAVLLLFPIFVWRKKTPSFVKALYILSLVQFFLIWNNAPQFRFFFMFFMLLTCVIASMLPLTKTVVKGILIITTLLAAIPLFIPLNLNQVASTTQLSNVQSFNWDHILIAHPNTRYTQLEHTEMMFGNIKLQSPVAPDFFWATGDCEVPCVHIKQLEYFKEHFKMYPQQIGPKVSDGFYAKTVSRE